MNNLVSDSLEEISHSLSSLLVSIIDGEETSFFGITNSERDYLEELNSLSRKGFVEEKLAESYVKMYNSSTENSSRKFRKRIRNFNRYWEMGLQIKY